MSNCTKEPPNDVVKTHNDAIDLVSRQDAIDAANRADYRGLAVEDVRLVTDEVVKELKRLPSAQPKTGKWIKDKHGYTVCSECGWNAPRIMTGSFTTKHLEEAESEFCWHCGAKMR